MTRQCSQQARPSFGNILLPYFLISLLKGVFPFFWRNKTRKRNEPKLPLVTQTTSLGVFPNIKTFGEAVFDLVLLAQEAEHPHEKSVTEQLWSHVVWWLSGQKGSILRFAITQSVLWPWGRHSISPCPGSPLPSSRCAEISTGAEICCCLPPGAEGAFQHEIPAVPSHILNFLAGSLLRNCACPWCSAQSLAWPGTCPNLIQLPSWATPVAESFQGHRLSQQTIAELIW